MPARIRRLSTGSGRKYPVTVGKASLMTEPMRQVWALRHQTGAQYSAVEWTWVKVAVRNVAPAPNWSQQDTWGVQCVMSTFWEMNRGVGGTWVSCPTLLRGRPIWVQTRGVGFHCCGLLAAPVSCWDERLPHCFCSTEL